MSPFRSLQLGLQRMDISNKIAVVASFPQIVGTIVFLENGYGLPGLMVNSAVVLFISSSIDLVAAFRILPDLKFNPKLFRKETFKRLFEFGYKIQIVKLGSLAGPQTDKLLISYFLSLGLVAFYQLSSTIIEQVKGFILLITSALLPAVSELDACNRSDRIRLLYLKSLKYTIFVALPLSFFIFINARLIIISWINQDLEKATIALQILMLAFFINILTGPGSVISAGIGKPEYQMRVAIIVFFLNLPLSIFFIFIYGFVGVLIGTAISYASSGLYFIHLINRELNVSFRDFASHTRAPFLACLASLGANGILIHLLAPYSPFKGRLINIGILSLYGLVFGSIFLAVLILNKYFDKEELSLLRRILRLKPF